ncbi:DUF4142 domain-containing protein [Iodidimonas sp. SYSU 1G8]|uniref:DUF4142 domain-containing protein n=1 Tax=Iodidimonas sp. SYSU 1G8 TaxID=3133967 RepID=UPI0031FEE74A
MRRLAILALTGSLLLPVVVHAETGELPTAAIAPTMSLSSETFARNASLAGLFDLQSAELALERAKDADILKLAREIVEEQSLANSRLRAFAPRHSVTELSGEYAASLERLKAAKAEEFDAVFLELQKASHRKTVALLERYQQTGEDDMLKAYASETLPFLKLHQSRVESLR